PGCRRTTFCAFGSIWGSTSLLSPACLCWVAISGTRCGRYFCTTPASSSLPERLHAASEAGASGNVRFRSTAEVHEQLASATWVAIDPTPSLTHEFCCEAQRCPLNFNRSRVISVGALN